MTKQIGDGNVIDADILGGTAHELRIAELETQLRAMTRQRDDANRETKRAQEDANRALSMLRTQLGPLYRALQAVFGELDAAGVTEAQGVTTSGDNKLTLEPSAKNAAVWASWKERFPPAVGKMIDALLLHGEMNAAQLKIACRIGSSTVTDGIYKLNKAGLIDKNGGKVKLKSL